MANLLITKDGFHGFTRYPGLILWERYIGEPEIDGHTWRSQWFKYSKSLRKKLQRICDELYSDYVRCEYDYTGAMKRRAHIQRKANKIRITCTVNFDC